jgi:16S rRNA (uracil1498-N3)-methyltransferase
MAAHPADHPGPFALVADLEAPVLEDSTRHHLERVLRLRRGDAVVIGDGTGRWCPARYDRTPDPVGPIETAPAAQPALTIAFALVKGDRPELVVRALTEAGVDCLVPFRAERSVVRWDGTRAAKALERLRAVARSATEQCHRPWLPNVEPVTDLTDLLARPGASLASRDGAPPSLDHPLVIVGPEGGWSPAEEDAAAARSVPRVALGPHVLRAETAAVSAGATLAALRAGLVLPSVRN